MGRFLSLAVLLPLAACGDNLVTDVNPAGSDEPTNVDGTDGASPRYVPSVCGVASWTSNITSSVMDVSVAGRPEGATVIAVPRRGGAASGFVVDTRMRMLGGEQKIGIDVPLSEVSVSYLGTRVAATGISGDSMFLYLLDDDLSNPQYVYKVPATTLAKPAFYQNVADDIIMPLGTDQGLMFQRFADSGEPIDNKLMVASKPVRSLATTQMGVGTLTAWATDTECYMMATATYQTGQTSYQSRACPNPSLAFNNVTGAGIMVFESPQGVRAMYTQGQQFGGDAALMRPDTTAPRALFDGQNFWISYLDARGDVIVGFMDADRHLVTMSLGGPHPYDSAYQLAMVEGAPWVFALDDTGYTGHRLCIDAQW
ncbi:MAG TPA: hypothetical protein VL326_23865 [Kofleriaceae bacterium]|jgi:hypothetical protein|nr:hypothetical protein [Kofleriaceae bacterium]